MYEIWDIPLFSEFLSVSSSHFKKQSFTISYRGIDKPNSKHNRINFSLSVILKMDLGEVFLMLWSKWSSIRETWLISVSHLFDVKMWFDI